MIFSRETLEIGGKITVPDGFVSADPGEIVSKTPAGINVEYGVGPAKQRAFYAYHWLNLMYGEQDQESIELQRSVSHKSCNCDDMNDEVPF